MSDDHYSQKEAEQRREAALKKMLATQPKHPTLKGKPSRAQSRKTKPVQPAKQRKKRQRGR